MNESLHPILRYMFISGSGEGWALYTETLADEMGLYSDAVTRIGMLSAEAQRAARLVIDPGIHVMGWTRQQAIDYMLENTALGVDSGGRGVDRRRRGRTVLCTGESRQQRGDTRIGPEELVFQPFAFLVFSWHYRPITRFLSPSATSGLSLLR